jgi:hypothetical protein
VFGEDACSGGGDEDGSGGGDDEPSFRAVVDGRDDRLDIETRGVEKPEFMKDGNEGPDPKPSRSLK